VRVAAARNPKIAIEKLKGQSSELLGKLPSERRKFDFVYLDGDRQTPQVLTDLVMAFHLRNIDGFIFCNDYLWQQRRGLVDTPKLAIDCFTPCFHFKVRILPERFYQLYLQKIADQTPAVCQT
jgi:Methyltransferase domain